MIRKITIDPVLNGFIATVGCQRLVFNEVSQLTFALEGYLKDPDKVEKIYRDKALNAKHMFEERAPEPCPPQTTANLGSVLRDAGVSQCCGSAELGSYGTVATPTNQCAR